MHVWSFWAVVGTPAALSPAVGQSSSSAASCPRSRDRRPRDSNDVLLQRICDFLDFDFSDFERSDRRRRIAGRRSGDNFDAGLGVGFYQRTVPAVDDDFVNADGTEIEQDLKLRIVPFTATVRLLPLGHHDGIEPYIGAGVGVFNYRYSETGQFVDDRQHRSSAAPSSAAARRPAR